MNSNKISCDGPSIVIWTERISLSRILNDKQALRNFFKLTAISWHREHCLKIKDLMFGFLKLTGILSWLTNIRMNTFYKVCFNKKSPNGWIQPFYFFLFIDNPAQGRLRIIFSFNVFQISPSSWGLGEIWEKLMKWIVILLQFN